MRAAGIICICLILLSGGCSKEQEPSGSEDNKTIVKPIKRPVTEEPQVSPAIREGGIKEEEPPTETPKVAVSKAPRVPEEVSKEIKTVLGEVGYYVVKDGDCLASIAGREDVYKDPLKWPVLYRLNMDKLGNMPVDEDFPEKNLTAGVTLKLVTPEEAEANSKERAQRPWVINVLSSPVNREIVPPAVRLVKEGYPVYICKAKVRGKDYMRLRVGFFEDRAAANKEGKKIMGKLNLTDAWINKIGEKELEEYGRY